MRVVHIIGGGDVGGAKVHVLSLVKELGKHIDVKIISLRHGAFADDAKAMGIDIEVVKSRNILADISKVTDIIRKGNFRIIHSHGAKANIFSLIARRSLGLPTVSTVHSDYRLDYMHSIFKNLTLAPANSFALKKVDYHIGVSEKFRNMLIERKFNPQNIFTVYNGMDFSKSAETISRKDFSSKYGLNLKDSDIIVGLAVRLYPVKDIDTLIKAAQRVVLKGPSVKFVIGGDGEDRKHLEQKVKSLKITNNVFFIGWLDNPYELMGNVDISVHTSISESFPYSILEGAMFKKVTVSSNVGGIPDLIEHGVNGCLFEPGDFETLASYILELAGSPQKRTEMGRKIYEKAKSTFSLESMCETQLSIYKQVISDFEVKQKTGTAYDAIISGYYGFENLGDDAMFEAILSNLRVYKPDIRVAALSKKPSEIRRAYRVNSINRANPFLIVKMMKQAGMFIYGGGNLIQDNTSSRSILYYLGTIWFAKKMGLKVMIYANGIGPLEGKLNIFLTKKIIDRVDIITVREKVSLEELKRLGIKKPQIYATADPALTVKASSDETAFQILADEGIIPQDKGRQMVNPLVGFSVRKLPGRKNRRHEKYEDAIANTADYLVQKYGVVPVFIPMQHNDLDIIDNVIAKMSSPAFAIRNRYDVSDTAAVIKQMDMVVGMRLHALIFAASAGVPVVGLVYDPKIEGFLQYIDQASSVAGHARDITPDRLISASEHVWSKRKQIRGELEKNVSLLKQKALENARIAVELLEAGREE
jgi:L-malate glycosyltransferase